MVTVNLEQRARELLAAEYERDGRPSDADFMRVGLPVCDADIRALRAIVAALRHQPAPVGDGLHVVHELLTNIKRSCIRGRNAADPTKGNSSFIATCDHIENLADEAIAALSRTHDVGTTGVLRGNADLVPAQHAYLTTRPEDNL